MANMKTDKEQLKKELRKLFRSMDFVGKKFLADEKAAGMDSVGHGKSMKPAGYAEK